MRTKRTVTTIERPPIPVLHIGAGRGTRLGLSAYEQFNATSPVSVLPTFLDAEPGKALAIVEEAKQRGIAAQALEARIEDVLGTLPVAGQTRAVVTALDHGTPNAEVIERTPPEIPAMGSLLVKVPFGPLYGLTFFLGREDAGLRLRIAKVFRQIGRLTVPRGSRAIVGDDGDLEDRAGEPFLRAALAARTGEILRKVASGLRPTVSPLELTIDSGASFMPVMIWEGTAWINDSQQLAEAVIAHLPHPLMRDESFAIIELVGEALRIHVARLRLDGRVGFERADSIDQAALTQEADEVRARTAAAVARAERQTIAPTTPVLTTD